MTEQCFVVSSLPAWSEVAAILDKHIPAHFRQAAEVAIALLVLQAKAEGNMEAISRVQPIMDGYNRTVDGK